MEDVVAECRNLTKNYEKKQVVHSFDLTLKKGHICGLIGPNGAGKTTIMRMMAGLTMPDAGEMRFFGKSDALDISRKRMAFMLEEPIVEPAMTAWENMLYVRLVKGIADESRIGKILELAGLANVGKKKVKQFSLGMKQRLGIAMALLNDAEVLVLDEPVNGLDPEGIVEIRHMLQKLAFEEGVSILISSHILAELSELCTDFVMIKRGTLVEALSHEELLQKCRSHIVIRTLDPNGAAAILEEKLKVKEYRVIHGEEIHLFEHVEDIPLVSRTLCENGQVITKLCCEGENLEDYYLAKVGESHE